MADKMEDYPIVIRQVEEDAGYFLCPNICGVCQRYLKEMRLQGSEEFGVSPMDEKTIDSIFNNALQCMPMFAGESTEQNTRKILAVGKVQSGKTAFFISCVAYAFDSGYQLCCLVGGTKDPLKRQNCLRSTIEFSNNPKVKVLEFNRENADYVRNIINNGFFVVLVVLKNASENKNVGALKKTLGKLRDIKTLVIDDEGDEYSPGAPKTKARNNATHRLLSEIIYLPKVCTYLSVTATPQANLLISTPDPLSPDSCVLVKPGAGYVGGIDFHDSFNNDHIEIINDSDDFNECIPDSFNRALRFFVLACCIKKSAGSKKGFSMLVNPSSLTVVHASIVRKIVSRIRDFKLSMKFDNPAFESEKKDLRLMFYEYLHINPSFSIAFDDILSFLPAVINSLDVYEYNSTSNGVVDRERADNDDVLYKILVGGGMLGRGLTINNLIVTYIFNNSKKTAEDTLYQRARWLGYKNSYFDVCKVFLTHDLQQKFIDTVVTETDMWISLESYVGANKSIKHWPRVFTLNNDKLMLTRTSVTKTVIIERVNPGYSYDKTIALPLELRKANRNLALNYLLLHKDDGFEVDFSNNQSQVAFVFKTSVVELIDSFLSKYAPPKGSTFGPLVFKTLKEKVISGDIPDEIFVLFLRYKIGEFRNGIAGDCAIGELPQGRNGGTCFSGDRNLPVYSSALHLQIHMVYTKKSQSFGDSFPVLALNNPISVGMIRYATGDNVYE